MEEVFLSYLKLLQELSRDLDRLAQLEQQKSGTVRDNDLLALDEVLKQEQAPCAAATASTAAMPIWRAARWSSTSIRSTSSCWTPGWIPSWPQRATRPRRWNPQRK